jgi:hypothetical protein
MRNLSYVGIRKPLGSNDLGETFEISQSVGKRFGLLKLDYGKGNTGSLEFRGRTDLSIFLQNSCCFATAW